MGKGELIENPKRIVDPKIKIQSLSTHPHADGRLGEVFLAYKLCWNFTGKRRRSHLPNSCSEW